MFGWFRKKPKAPHTADAIREAVAAAVTGGLFSTHGRARTRDRQPFMPMPFQPPKPSRTVKGASVGMDTDDGQGGPAGAPLPTKPDYGSSYGTISDTQLSWFASQAFIGYQLCALLSQHWLIDKACSMPAKDAVRNGYDLKIDGADLPKDIHSFIRAIDKQFGVKRQLIEFVRKGRIFGIRIAMFKVDSDDPEYYLKPFNIDGVAPGAYRGIVQIDPYWIVPELISQNLINPDDLHFYVPEFWRISGQIIHRSHLIIFTTGDVPDVLKPSYYYGGVSVPQRIYERVYAAERSANEAPMLLMTKRLTVMMTDLAAAVADPDKFQERMQWWTENRDNYGVKLNGPDDKLEQFDTALADVDAVILTQYQLSAAIAEVPGTKLLGTQPKGFNSTGEFEESSYHEFLESLQENDMTPLLDRHYLLVMKSYIEPKFGVNKRVDISWNELDAMTAQEQAAVNATKAATGAALVASGAIEPRDETGRLIADPQSGYSGLQIPPPEPPPSPAGAPGGGGAEPPAGTRAAAAGVAAKLPAPKQTAEKGA